MHVLDGQQGGLIQTISCYFVVMCVRGFRFRPRAEFRTAQVHLKDLFTETQI